MTVLKCIFNSILKNSLARGTPGYCKWHPRMPRHPGWEPLPYNITSDRRKSIVCRWTDLIAKQQ